MPSISVARPTAGAAGAAAAASAAAAVAATRAGVYSVTVPGPPIDLSFRSIRSLADIHGEDNSANQSSSSDNSQDGDSPSNAAQDFASVSYSNSPRLTISFGPRYSLRNPARVSFLPSAPAAPAASAAAAATPTTTAATTEAAAAAAASPPIRKSICLSRNARVVSVCSMALKGNASSSSVHAEEKKRKFCYISRYTTAIRLNNNEMQEAPELKHHLSLLLPKPQQNLLWLDLSFNKLQAVPPSLAELDRIQCIYLHCNKIEDPLSILVLQNNKHLHALTLTRNPIEIQLDTQYR